MRQGSGRPWAPSGAPSYQRSGAAPTAAPSAVRRPGAPTSSAPAAGQSYGQRAAPPPGGVAATRVGAGGAARAAAAPGGAGRAAVGAGGGKAAVHVSTQSKKDEIGIQTLVGDYDEQGSNHGKKVYKKSQTITGHEDVQVFLYYWDTRDGDDFSGWWFGDQVGGSQVWARAASHGPAPPRTGWKVPWDAPRVEPGLLFVDAKGAGGGGPAPPGPTAGAVPVSAAAASRTSYGYGGGQVVGSVAGNAAQKARMSKATADVEAVEASIKEVVSAAKQVQSTSGEAVLMEAVESLQTQQQALLDTQKALTADITEARKGGPSATAHVTDLSKLSPRLRSLQGGLSSELGRLKAHVNKAQNGAADAKKQAENTEAAKRAEEKDSQEFKVILADTQEMLAAAEDSVNAVAMTAAPLIAEPPDDQGDFLERAMEEIEAAASDAQGKISEVRQHLSQKCFTAARKFAPETRKAALAEFSAMQGKLKEASKKAAPYTSFKKEFHARVEARKALQDLADKLSSAELEVEKAKMMTSAAEQGDMPENEVVAAEKLVKPVERSIDALLKSLESKLAGADGAAKDEASSMKDRALATKKSIDGVMAVLRRQRESFVARDMLAKAGEKVDKAEESMNTCAEAEMPFLKGIEILPSGESATAISACQSAATETEEAITKAKSYIGTKTAEVKKYAKELETSVTEEMKAHSSRLEAVAKKLATFKKETAERKVAALLAEVVEAVMKSENSQEALSKGAKIFSTEALESVSVEELKEAVETATAAEKEASKAFGSARRVHQAKQKEAKSSDAVAGLSKLQARLTTVKNELDKTRKTLATGEKLIKGKDVLVSEGEKIAKAEEDVNVSERKVKPGEEEKALGIESATPSDEDIAAIGTTLVDAQKSLKSSSRQVEANLAGAPASLKGLLQKLADRCKASLAKITVVLNLTKDHRERVSSELYVKQAQEKTDEVDKAVEKVNEAELPWLKGLEVLPLEETRDSLAASDVAAKEVGEAVSSARTFIAAKSLELKQFGQAVALKGIEELAALTTRVNSGSAKLAQFKKDTETRKKVGQVQEATAKMSSAETEVKAMAEVAEPFTREKPKGEEKEEKEDELSEEVIEKLVGQFNQTTKAMDEAQKCLAKAQRDLKGMAPHADALKELQSRYQKAQGDVSKFKKVASVHEQKYVAKKLLQETQEKLSEMEAEVAKTTKFCAPLTEHGGEKFLVASSVRILAAALRDHMEKKELSREAAFREISGGAPRAPEEAFLNYLEKLPEATGHDEAAFTAERRVAVFKQIADIDGLGFAQFEAIFKESYICVKEVSVTECFEVAKAKKVAAKIETGALLETDQSAKKDGGNGMMRIHCTIVESGISGYVTMQGNQGTKFIELVSPFTIFCEDIDKSIEANGKNLGKMAGWFSSKLKELQAAIKDSPLAEARTELNKLRGKVNVAQDDLSKLKTKANKSKQDFARKEAAEKNAHIEAKERKTADALLEPAQVKVEAMEADAKRLEEAAKPLISASLAELGKFATPSSVAEEVEKLAEALVASSEEAKKVIAEQQEELAKVGKAVKGPMSEAPNSGKPPLPAGPPPPSSKAKAEEELAKVRSSQKGPMFEAKRDFQKMNSKASGYKEKSSRVVAEVKKKCQVLVEQRRVEVSYLLRTEMGKKGMTVEKFFMELVRPGDNRISEEGFASYVSGLQGEDYKAEHVKLLCRSIDSDGIGRRKFEAFVQQFYVVVKSIAITDQFDISKAKTVRKADVEEVIEVVEGPSKDDKLGGIERVKGRSLADGAEGWISLKGNQGTPFLQEVEKPYYVCKKDVPLEKEFKLEDANGQVRVLGADEVVELIEGPRKQSFEPGKRVRGKASSDGATGWFTAKDKNGVIFAESDNKYYICTSSVAITDNKDIKACKVLRKLAVDELFTLEEGPIVDPDNGMQRVKGQALKDDAIGWITLQGNAGTVFAEASTKHWSILSDVPLTKKFPFGASGEEVRTLAKGDVMQALEKPKEETFAPEVRIRCKTLSDGAEGWLTLNERLRPWTSIYRCKIAAPIHETLALEGAKEIRQAALGEAFDLMEGPSTEGKALRMKARATKDGAVGWVTIRDGDGKQYFGA